MRTLFTIILLITLTSAFHLPFFEREIRVRVDRINVIYENSQKSFGGGRYFFAGRTAKGFLRRSLIHFDYGVLRNISQAEDFMFLSARFEVTCSQSSNSSTRTMMLMHPLLEDWGVNLTDPSHEHPGQGVVARPNDATWFNTFYPSMLWKDVGGTYDDSSISSVEVSMTEVRYSFDFTHHLNQIQFNFSKVPYGYMLRSSEILNYKTAKGFYSNFFGNEAMEPVLIVTFTTPAPLWFWVSIIAIVLGLVAAVVVVTQNKNKNKSFSYKTIRNFKKMVDTVDLVDILQDENIVTFPVDDLEFGEILGVGGEGSVMEGTILSTNKRVAVKKINLNVSTSQADMAALRGLAEEIRILSSVAHPNILRLYGIVVFDGYVGQDVGVITELIENGSIADLYYKKKVILEEEIIFQIILEICYGLHYLHSLRPRIIHRDLKPGNILLTTDYSVRIADFGMSKMIGQYSKTLTTSGTPQYMAPESINRGKFSEKSDVYSFGILMWEILEQKRPYKGIHPYKVMHSVISEGLRPNTGENWTPSTIEIYTACVQSKPADRPNIKEIITHLEENPTLTIPDPEDLSFTLN